ncbi:SIMPL domain-containing protein [Treponema sp. OttesenSCG-928-L16]|nr:SIMPL domain-containing protein [Treponema sp. OttesenSCG-928-L16]
MKKKLGIFIPALICFALLFTGCGKAGSNESTIAVSGTGTVFAQPDLVQMRIGLSHTAPTTGEAKKTVDERVRQVLSILKDTNIDDTNIMTVNLTYDTETEYQNGRSVWVGQSASQSILVTINDIHTDTEKLPALLDKISAVDKVSIHNISFDVKEKTELFEKARELAYQKAYAKAEQFAALSGLKIVRVLNISEGYTETIPYGSQSNVMYDRLMSTEAAPSANVPTGEQEITSTISAVFLLK